MRTAQERGRSSSECRLGSLDFETASRPFVAIAALAHRDADDLCDEAFHGKTHASMLPRYRRQGAPVATDYQTAVALDSSQRAELFVQQRARCGYSRLEPF